MSSTETLQRSPLHDLHVNAGGKLIDFHGWLLPVQYTSVIQEHQATRTTAGLFDISHMGQVMITGKGAFAFLQNLITNDLRRGTDKKLGVYAHLCLPTGGVIDDVFIYTLNPETFFVVVNSSTHEKDVAWFRKNVTTGTTIYDLEHRGALAIQGPKALEIVRQTIAGVAELPRFAYQLIKNGEPNETFWGCRTGYTGEEGAEFFGPAESIALLWRQLVEVGSGLGLRFCGLGARDTLRLEMGYPLYGNDLNEKRTPLEANLAWVVNWDKGDFIGREALWEQKEKGTDELLLAYELLERGVPREGALVFKDGIPGGQTTSGTFSPSLSRGIGLAYAPRTWAEAQTPLEVEIHGKRVPAKAVKLPFYRKR